jgi:hypothetical protein
MAATKIVGAWAAVAAASTLVGVSPVSAQTRGEEWEYAMATEVEGMKLKLPPSKVCLRPEEGNTPTVDKNCQLKDVKVSGGTTNFRIVCGPPEPGEGIGRFTRKGDRVEGRYTMKNADGEMVVTTDGRKVGTCDLAKATPQGGRK